MTTLWRKAVSAGDQQAHRHCGCVRAAFVRSRLTRGATFGSGEIEVFLRMPPYISIETALVH